MSDKLKALGLCLGASTVSIVQLEHDRSRPFDPTGKTNPRIIDFSLHPHEGDPKQTVLKAFDQIDLDSFDRIAATGRKFRKFVNLSSISEPQAVELAYPYVKPADVDCPAVVSAGGETFMVYALDPSGRIANVITGNKCASGTGEFFLQQLRRMDVSLDEAAGWAAVDDVHHVSGRCSVFCKSDCTHATNKGIPRSQVTAGLCRMMANKILELLKKVDRRNIMVAGGTARNHTMIQYLQQDIPGLIVPEQAPYFEALGAALWALDNQTSPYPGRSKLLLTEMATFDHLPPLQDYADQVEFKTLTSGQIQAQDDCILGLDVGSTTTKAVLLRKRDNALLASIYLRTSGDPVGASRKCYRSILEQIGQQLNPSDVSISGLGVCGSGRQIAGLHALTDGVINEIIAHATAAVYFDPQVDTIFEIGGQDAKYTYITNAVASDYAMNEACSAGTGSFLEESALETLGVEMEAIADIALKGRRPPNFNDQCAAFISSDIKNAIHEGVAHEDIVAGLVYSICMNYSNRVKGNRPVGEKVFMQGGVCYNRAVPLAMASLVGKPIIVPPEPGLMGAFGVALEVKKRIDSGLMESGSFDLQTLVDREVAYKKPFVCGGGKEKCDRRCEIAMIEIEGRKYPFGGACNRYYNLRHKVSYDIQKLDLVRLRQDLIFNKYGTFRPDDQIRRRGSIGFNRSFLVNSYFPLYSTFFTALGFEIVMPDSPVQKGIDRQNASFCYPVELSHGFFYSLLNADTPPEYIFLPHFKAIPGENDTISSTQSQVCPLVQGETFYLQTTFRKEIAALKQKGTGLLAPLIDLSQDLADARAPLVKTALKMGVSRQEARRAFDRALHQQKECLAEMKSIGRQTLRALENDPQQFAVVLFARPYNGFVEEAHMGIPHKFASRGVTVIPLDFLDLNEEHSKRHMYWGMGKLIMKACRIVERHPQLFGTYITNFSCGPDSFVVGDFKDIMGRKPSLTLELDSHTADAGLETRVEAFLDIVNAYRQLVANHQIAAPIKTFKPARTVLDNGTASVVTSRGDVLPLTDPRVTVLLPSMGKYSSEAFAAILRGSGLNARAHRPSDTAVLKMGRANTTCKECLPLILTTGTLLSYINNGKRDDEVLVYFFATGSGPCRFGQYYIFMEDLVKRLEIPDVALFALSSENSYVGMGEDFERRGWWAVIVSDVIEDIRSMLLTNAKVPVAAMGLLEQEWQKILIALEGGDYDSLEHQLIRSADCFRGIALKRPAEDVPVITLSGEIFVRRDALSRQNLTERLAQMGFATVCSPVAEWVLYCNYMVDEGLNPEEDLSILDKVKFKVRNKFQARYEKRIKSILSTSGLVHATPLDMDTIIKNASPYISRDLPGEAVLTVGGSLTEVVSHSCGVIAIGPFGCMPNRLSESILNETMNSKDKIATEPHNEALRSVLTDIDQLPFLAIESDGSPFPQLINAKLETFCLRAERLHQRMMGAKSGTR